MMPPWPNPRTILLVVLLFPYTALSQISLVDSLVHRRSAEPGEVYDGLITVVNSGRQSTTVRVHNSDYLFLHDAGENNASVGKQENSNAGWIELEHPQVEIPAYSTVEIPYSVTVPSSPEISGTFWSMVLLEEVDGNSTEGPNSENDLDASAQTPGWHWGVKIVTSVGQFGTRDLKLVSMSQHTEKSSLFLQIEVENGSERQQTPLLWAEVFTVDGRYIERFQFNRLRIYPGNSTKFETDLSHLPTGTFKALIVGRFISYGNAKAGAQTQLLMETTAPFELTDTPWKFAGRVKGKVYDQQTNQPLPQIVLRINELSAVTDAYGNYIFPPIKPGSYLLTVDRLTVPTHMTTVESNPKVITVSKNEDLNLNIAMTASGSLSGRILLYENDQTVLMTSYEKDSLELSGGLGDNPLLIRGPGGQAVTGLTKALVQLSNDMETRRRVTDATGQVQFDDLPQGKWVLRINKYYLPEGRSLETDSLVVDIQPKQEAHFALRILPVAREKRLAEVAPHKKRTQTEAKMDGAPKRQMSARSAAAHGDRYYDVVRGDWLYALARKFYGSAAKFVDIYQANAGNIQNPDLIYPGQRLLIPAPQTNLGSSLMAEVPDAFEIEYEAALKLYHAEDYQSALSRFQALLRTDSRNSLSDNCQYWIGECLFALNRFQEAAVEFEKVFSFQNSNKHDDAQIMLGFTNLKLGDKLQAFAEFERLMLVYPHSEYYHVAQRYHERLRIILHSTS